MNVYNNKFVTCWDLNARRYVLVDRNMKRKARKIARVHMKRETMFNLETFYMEENENESENERGN